MNIGNITLEQAREIAAMFNNQPAAPAPTYPSPFEVDEPYFIRTVTHHLTGRLIAVYPQELVLINAAWIADDGRFNIAVKTGTFNEVEPFPPEKQVIVGRNSIIDAVIIPNLPTEVK